MTFLMPTELETERLILRTFKDEDWRDLHKYYSDEVCTKYTYGRPLSEGETWRAMAGMIGHWHLRGYGPYALEEKILQKVIGVTGLWYPNDWPEPEIKWGLARHMWGKGFAKEAALAVRKIAYDKIPNCNLISLIFSENSSSIKLATSIGAKLEKEIVFRDHLTRIYRHQRPLPE